MRPFTAFRKSPPATTRELVLSAIGTNPGITKAELCRLTGLGWGTVYHHVRHLMRNADVRAQGTRRRVYLYTSSVHSEQLHLMRLMRDEAYGSIIGELQRNPGSSLADLGRNLDFTRKMIRRFMADLHSVGVVAKTEEYHPKYSLALPIRAQVSQAPPTVGVPVRQSGPQQSAGQIGGR
jgi:predicted transcriptional regulator